MVKGTIGAFWIFMQWPLLQAVALSLPPFLIFSAPVKLFNEYMGVSTSFLQWETITKSRQDTRQKIAKVKARIDAGEKSTRPTIFKQLLDPNATEGHVVPDVGQLTDDAFIIIAAATDTTGNAMAIATYNALSNPSIYGKLKDELKAAFPDENSKLDFVTLEKLPYLVRDFKLCSTRRDLELIAVDCGDQRGASAVIRRCRTFTTCCA